MLALKVGTAMKRVKMFIHEPSINKIIGYDVSLLLVDEADLLDAIKEVDRMINSKGSFPKSDYNSLLHMIYNPAENRFYKQVAITAYKKSGQALNVRDNPKKELPEKITITLIPAGGCISEWEEAMDYEKFLEEMSQEQLGSLRRLSRSPSRKGSSHTSSV